MKAVLSVVALVLAVGCTKPYVAPPLGPSPVLYATPPPTSNPTPPAASPLIVSLLIGRTSPEVGQAISFVAASSMAITRADWNFGNGVTLTTATGDTAYRYPAVGTFLVHVTATARDGRTGSAAQSVTVQPKPSAPTPTTEDPTPTPNGFVASIACEPKAAGIATTCHATVAVDGMVQPSQVITKVNWDFGDGVTTSTYLPTAPVTSHVFAGAGSYTVFAAVFVHSHGATPLTDDFRVVSTAITIP